jgi:ComF family protein
MANLPPGQSFLCLPCQLQLPATEQYLLAENAFTELFWGRIQLEGGAAQYYFSKSGRVQRLIHQLKYQHKPEIGYQLGLAFGQQLKEQSHFQGIDAIVPVPLHPKKKHIRGYNQAEAFGKGLAESMEVPLIPDLLYRKKFTTTQTKKSRMERLQNVLDAFALSSSDQAAGKHFLLVDDVLTTGATLEACALQILQAEGSKVSMATIAMAE